jgi:hypothetical protein
LSLGGDSSSDDGVQFQSIASSGNSSSLACTTDISVSLNDCTKISNGSPGPRSISESSSDCDVLSLDCSDFENIDEQEIIDVMSSKKTKLREAQLEEQSNADQQTPQVVVFEAEVQTVAVIPLAPLVWRAPPAVLLAPRYLHGPNVYQAPVPHLMQQTPLQNFQPYFLHRGFQQFHPFQQYPFDARAGSSSQAPNLSTDDLRHTLSRH